MSDRDARALLAGLAAGEESAFAELHVQFGTRLFRCAHRMLGHAQDAEEVVQEVFFSLVRSRDRLLQVDNLPGYLFTALRHAAQRYRTRQPRTHTSPDVLSDMANPPASISKEVDAELEHALRMLPTEQREVLAMKIDGELTFAEIGRVLQISPHTAASRYRYALQKLRGILTGDVSAVPTAMRKLP
jgi:RNA polymerase sigma-70 factor, ECF subfamily